MATAWQTLEEPALTLGISSRTLHRRIARGEFETRLANGRREVLVTIPDPQPAAPTQDSPPAPHPQPTLSDMSAPAPDTAHSSDIPSALSADVTQTMLTLHEDRVRRTDLAILAYQQSVSVAAAEARRVRIGSRVAWSLAASLTVICFLTVTWATHKLTRASAHVDALSHKLNELSANTDAMSRQANLARQEAEFARIAAARAEGQLFMLREQSRASANPIAAAAQQPVPAPTPNPLPMSTPPATQPTASTLSPAPVPTTQPLSLLTQLRAALNW
jgi:hypothetical protein